MTEKLILASASPRRVELLRQIGIEPIVLPVDAVEIKTGTSPKQVVEYNAKLKAEAAAELRPSTTILAADTIVAMGNNILGKPASKQEAINTLELLSGKSHSVFTCVAVIVDGKLHMETVETKVHFAVLTTEEIKAYVNTGEPMDKAGAYGIQGKGALLVKAIEGDYSNVVGLPISAVKNLLSVGDFADW